MSVAFKGERYLFATGRFISLKQWDKNAKRIKHTVDTTIESIADGEWLDEKKINVEQFLKTVIRETKKLSKADILNVIRGESKIQLGENVTLSEIFEDFLKNHKNFKGDQIGKNTRKNYYSLCVHLTKFQGSSLFKPDTYTTERMLEFKEYLSKEAQLIDSTVSKYLKGLKPFLRYLQKKGHCMKIEFHEIRTPENEQIVVAIDAHELQILENIELENTTQQQVRDLFLFQCYTGSRYSDIENIKQVDLISVNDKPFWRYMSIKSNIELSVPLNVKAIKILDKYKDLNTPLPKYTNQALNREIKKIAKYASLNRIVKQLEYIGGKRLETIYPLHEVISSHTARKTFITKSLHLGIPERKVRAITGHKDERSFRRYVDFNSDSLLEVTEAWEK